MGKYPRRNRILYPLVSFFDLWNHAFQGGKLFTYLFRNGPSLISIGNDCRRNEQDQLGTLLAEALAAKQATNKGNLG